MINEEAIEILSCRKKAFVSLHTEAQLKKKENVAVLEAYDAAIKALEEQRNMTNEELYQGFINLEAENERLHDRIEALQQESCEDAISQNRQCIKEQDTARTVD